MPAFRHVLARLLPAVTVALALAAWPGAGTARPQALPAAFRPAEGTRHWRFPRDHGRHDAYRLEWWYFTGIVRTAGGRAFGYQVTIFRQGIAGARPGRASAWAARALYLGQAALSDLADGRYLHAARSERGALGLAGAAPDRLQAWVGPWRIDPLAGDPDGARIAVDTGTFALALTLHGDGPPVLNGDHGLDRKGPRPGQASWYYSQPRMATRGTVTLGGKTYAVQGATWMDHEFGTNQLAPEQAGWDWMGLRLADGSALMLYRLRRTDGSVEAQSGGTYVAPDGRATPLRLAPDGPGAATMTPGTRWRSPATGADYPLRWHIVLPAQGLRLDVRPALDDQEQRPGPGAPFAYWEGVVWVEGTRNGAPVRGEGYLELTGYAGSLARAFR